MRSLSNEEAATPNTRGKDTDRERLQTRLQINWRRPLEKAGGTKEALVLP